VLYLSPLGVRETLKLALIGFVFLDSEGGFIFIILCNIGAYTHFGFLEIGFVLHKKSPGAPGFSSDCALKDKKAVFDGVL